MATRACAATQRIDTLPNSGPADAVPAPAGLISNFIAWQQSPGVAGPAEIRVRYAPDGSDLLPEQVVSSPTLGATDAARGLVAAGDVAGDAAVAWVQGTGAGTEIVAAQLFQAPGGFVASNRFRYVTTASPPLVWSQSAELWGAPTYILRIDGVAAGQTTAQSMVPPAPLTDGRHSYQLGSVNLAGVTTNAAAATVFVDTVAPRLAWRLNGTRTVNTREHVRVTYSDPRPPDCRPATPRAWPRSMSGGATARRRSGSGARAPATSTGGRGPTRSPSPSPIGP